jgi:FtsP/CotA-like multicopper oxidase with cupredoxin domain
VKRRTFIKTFPALLASTALTGGSSTQAHAESAGMHLRAEKIRRRIPGSQSPTTFWGYNEVQPGPILRYTKGDRVSINLENHLDYPTTIHWHGLRIPNKMDGVPHLTQPPVQPGEIFHYEFNVPDSGTFWYHPHENSHEQVGRGMFGAFIVDEKDPIDVDREIIWVLSDFLINLETGVHSPFGVIGQHASKGRLGNVIMINDEVAGPAHSSNVRSGERIRFRLINSATARIFRLDFQGHEPWTIAFDGQATTPHKNDGQPLLLGPGMRLDLIIDMALTQETVTKIVDTASGKILSALKYTSQPTLRTSSKGAPMTLERNHFSKLNLKKAVPHYIEFHGGNSGPPVIGLVNGAPVEYNDMKNKFGLAWTVNRHAAHEASHNHEPLLTLKRGQTHIISISNKTGFDHPIHLHGHFFRVLRYNDSEPLFEEWRDTVFLGPWADVDIALYAEEPGDWMFHCHILEHAASGMMGTFRVE